MDINRDDELEISTNNGWGCFLFLIVVALCITSYKIISLLIDHGILK